MQVIIIIFCSRQGPPAYHRGSNGYYEQQYGQTALASAARPNETEISEVLKELRLLDHPKCKDEVDHRALLHDLKNRGKVSFMILVDLQDSVYCIVHA